MAIRDVKIWKDRSGTDWRVYVHTTDNREGCLYVTGNKWNEKGKIEGDLTEAEWEEARKLAYRDGVWHKTYADNADRPARKYPKEGYAPNPGQGHGNPNRCSERYPCGVCFDCVCQ